MKLADWMALVKIKDGPFAEKVGRDQSTISRIRRGEVLPDWSTVALIHKATDGAVTANDFLPAAAPAPAEREAAA
jgi:transcriptional regulator with XRE-family HTH domain